uniref:RNase H type-1 domain-containing protein n=1 Tax=Fagus sylvatica TaxID=28930 RepID=A0A2N9I461_FAGSY
MHAMTYPPRIRLFDKGIPVSYSCAICHDEAETVIHILWNCSYAWDAWNLFTQAELELFTTLLWRLWGHWNEVIMGNQQPSVTVLVQGAAHFAALMTATRMAVHPRLWLFNELYKFCLDMGFWQLEVECEDITLVRCLQDDAPVYSEIGLLVEDIRELLLRFQYFSIDLIVKTCNAAARALALSAQANEKSLNLA